MILALSAPGGLLFVAVLLEDFLDRVHDDDRTVEVPHFAVVALVRHFANALDRQQTLFVIDHQVDDLVLDLDQLVRAAPVEAVNRRVAENPENRRIENAEEEHLGHPDHTSPVCRLQLVLAFHFYCIQPKNQFSKLQQRQHHKRAEGAIGQRGTYWRRWGNIARGSCRVRGCFGDRRTSEPIS